MIKHGKAKQGYPVHFNRLLSGIMNQLPLINMWPRIIEREIGAACAPYGVGRT